MHDSQTEVIETPSFKCKDLGMKCDFEATAKTKEELMKKITDHAAKVRNMKAPLPPDMMQKVKDAVKK